ncbi:MAG: Na(+)/H(+) antiporter subunit B, partial [Rhodospirillaceae bacterium]
MRHHLILRVVSKLLIPLLLLFALYVQMHGDFGPGGGFQAGAIAAAAIVLYALIFGRAAALEAVPLRVVEIGVPLGVLVFAGVGVANMLMGGNFLDYDMLNEARPADGQHVGILLVEAGVLITVFSTLLTIFYTF